MRVRRLLAVLALASCTQPKKTEPVASASPAASSVPAGTTPVAISPVASAPPVPRPALESPPQVQLLETADAGAKKIGIVAVPVGAREPRPIVVALHGGSDHPEWACDAWRGITSGYPFVVCPRGTGNEAALAWASPADTKLRVARAIAATMVEFEGWVREGPIVLVGFSMGATQAAFLAASEPTTYPRVSFAESAYAPEPAMTFAKPWAAGGGERAIFLCTTPGCVATYRRAAKNVATQHVPARLNIAGTSAHGMWPEVQASMRRDWPWLVEGLPGWSTYAPPVEPELPGATEALTP